MECSPTDGACAAILLTNSAITSVAGDLAVSCAAFFGTTVLFSGGQERGSKQEIHDRFIGAWRLAWLEESDADGTVHKADCTGLLVYTRDGHMSVQVTRRPVAKPARCNMRKGATRLPSAAIDSTRTRTRSLFMSKVPW